MLTARQRFELKKIIEELKRYKGRHTELVSVYIPKGYDINKIVQHLIQEKSTAENIKSASTRKNVIAALEKMIQHLKLYKTTPENGLAIFSGNVAEEEGKQDIKIITVEPPEPIKIRIYRCDKTFVTEPLEELIAEKSIYGLVVLDRRDANIALLKGKTIIPLVKTHSHVPGKHKAGGQSALRFQRLAEIAKGEHFKKVAEYMKEQFLNMKDLKGIIIGGPGPTKYDFINAGYLTNELKRKIIVVKDLSYTGDFGLQELVDKSRDILAAEEIAEEKAIMQKFFELLARKPRMVSYGKEHVINLLERGAVETLLLSESIPIDEIDRIEKKAKAFATEIKIISTSTREGIQLKELGGYAAILRYEI